jgi:hypothetical protein
MLMTRMDIKMFLRCLNNIGQAGLKRGLLPGPWRLAGQRLLARLRIAQFARRGNTFAGPGIMVRQRVLVGKTARVDGALAGTVALILLLSTNVALLIKARRSN